MKRYRRFWGALLAAVLVVGILPAASAADKGGPSAPGLAAGVAGRPARPGGTYADGKEPDHE